ncbi:hypothetical protein G0Q06_11400 [Puniceicoccales bacterium CK1056]|uniref:Uncharacterized protein n=1 Tax=Oceanipulchritudo coccoides TaxID=2706888 RepID=A0A6B2M5V1_9BACT|nr:hypothetical protein [Oceanipulchritudo coccoides]NDV63060.1 hypothetical protein [Oceanipulchritudo coccoides]
MKNIIKITLITVLAIGLNTGRATAGDDAAAAIGGFVLGMITGAIIEDHSDNVHVSVGARYGHDHSCRKSCSIHHGRDHGRWEIRKVKVWVPGYWDVRVSRCGDRVRIWKSGHYTYRKDRVWVSYRDRGCGKHDRDHGRHYGRDRDRDYKKDYSSRKERWFRG